MADGSGNGRSIYSSYNDDETAAYRQKFSITMEYQWETEICISVAYSTSLTSGMVNGVSRGIVVGLVVDDNVIS